MIDMQLAALITYLKAHPLYLAGSAAGLVALGLIIYFATRKSTPASGAALPVSTIAIPPAAAAPKLTILPMRMIICPSNTKGQVVNGKFQCVPKTQTGGWQYHASGGCWAQTA